MAVCWSWGWSVRLSSLEDKPEVACIDINIHVRRFGLWTLRQRQRPYWKGQRQIKECSAPVYFALPLQYGGYVDVSLQRVEAVIAASVYKYIYIYFCVLAEVESVRSS